MFETNLIAIALLSPLIVALFTLIFKNSKNLRDSLGFIGALISFYASIKISIGVLNHQNHSLFLFHLFKDLEFSFNVTPLGAIFGLVCSGLWILAAIYSVGYMRGNNEKKQTRFYSFYALSIFGALCVAWSSNLLLLFIFYEFLTFATYPLVAHKETEQSLKASRLYLGILVGSSLLFFLPAIIWVWYSTGTLNFVHGGILTNSFNPGYAPILLMLFIFGIGKAAIMPLHWWLPAAMVAPTPVSALLHAVAVVKAGVFSILMVCCYIFGIDFISETNSSNILIWIACFTILMSSIIAIQKDDLKARLAYSTVSQLSYIVLGGLIATQYSVIGSSMHIMMHAVGKITLFFCAGAIYVGAHLTKISQLDGTGKKIPIIYIAFAIGALSIIGIPPMGGSWSKFYLMMGAAQSMLTVVIIILIISSVLNAFYLLEPVFRAFYNLPKENIEFKVPQLVTIPIIASTGLIILLFFFYSPLLSLSMMVVK